WPAPAGVLLKGMVIGGLYALVALGLALVYRANRIINFAQGDLGGAPAALAVLLIVSVGVPYVVGILTGLVAGVVLGIVVEFVVILALAWFLNRTHMGVAVRACAESSDRASLLGVPVKRVNMVVWAVASLLATVALILRAGVVGLPIGSALGLPLLLPTLAAAA